MNDKLYIIIILLIIGFFVYCYQTKFNTSSSNQCPKCNNNKSSSKKSKKNKIKSCLKKKNNKAKKTVKFENKKDQPNDNISIDSLDSADLSNIHKNNDSSFDDDTMDI